MSDINQENPQSSEPVVSVPKSAKKWYIVHAYSGMEKSVQRMLFEGIQRAGMSDMFGQILVPTEEVIEVKNGKKLLLKESCFLVICSLKWK